MASSRRRAARRVASSASARRNASKNASSLFSERLDGQHRNRRGGVVSMAVLIVVVVCGAVDVVLVPQAAQAAAAPLPCLHRAPSSVSRCPKRPCTPRRLGLQRVRASLASPFVGGRLALRGSRLVGSHSDQSFHKRDRPRRAMHGHTHAYLSSAPSHGGPVLVSDASTPPT